MKYPFFVIFNFTFLSFTSQRPNLSSLGARQFSPVAVINLAKVPDRGNPFAEF